MKIHTLIKILLIVSVVALIGCSSDDSTSTVEVFSDGSEYATALPGPKVKRISETVYSPNQSTNVINFNYNSNGVLLNIVSPQYKMGFNYEGNKIVKAIIERNGSADEQSFFLYESDLLIKIIDGNVINKYTYQNGVLHSFEQGYGSEENYDLALETEFIFNGGNISETITTTHYGAPQTSKRTYTSYDTKNSPYKNMNPVMKHILGTQTFQPMSENNYLTSDYYSSINTDTPVVDNYEITYNNDDYPILIKKVSYGSVVSEIKILYQ